MSNNEKLVEVYKARSDMEAQVIKSLLESYDIPCFLKSNAAPSVHLFTVDGMAEVRILVMDSMADRAKELIVSDRNG
ncbi:MAG: DUF2007 domain-containing protein [Dehalococcoidales bacterium]|nr:DUF2007 domain-containing protein [Dehalococcoidales bacterium]